MTAPNCIEYTVARNDGIVGDSVSDEGGERRVWGKMKTTLFSQTSQINNVL